MIDLDISEKIIIIGQSGSGKTTLEEFFINSIPFKKIIIDSVGRFSSVTDIHYKGIVGKSKTATYIKIRHEGDFETICKVINNNYAEPVYLIVDEIDQYTNPLSMQRETSLFFQQGRNYDHGGMFTVRQIGRTNKQIFTNCRYIFLFSTHNKNDILYLQQSLPFNIGEMIYNLDKYQFYIIDSFKSENLGKYMLSHNNIIRV